MKTAWNWCERCDQPVDVGPEEHDGSAATCWGCGRRFVVVEMEDGSFSLDVEDEE